MTVEARFSDERLLIRDLCADDLEGFFNYMSLRSTNFAYLEFMPSAAWKTKPRAGS
jgi:hypothetical protein